MAHISLDIVQGKDDFAHFMMGDPNVYWSQLVTSNEQLRTAGRIGDGVSL